MNNDKQKLSMDAHLESIAIAQNATTIMTQAPNGGYLIYVSPREKDITRGVMSALISIKMKREEMGEENDTVKIRPVGIATPGNEFYYELKNEAGLVLTNGYAPTEQAARRKMAAFELKRKPE